MISSSILLLCSSLATSDPEARLACRHAFEAGVSQSGQSKAIQKYTKAKEGEVKEVLGEDVILFGASIYTILIKQELVGNLRGFASTESAAIRIRQDQASLNLNWRF
jgi:hypothetical protein